MERGVITHLATNGACAIHDFELAHIGATLEDVEDYIWDGKFGNWEETGRYLNEAIVRGYRDKIGFGEAIADSSKRVNREFLSASRCEHVRRCISLGVPFTVHKGIGFDIIDSASCCGLCRDGMDDRRGFSAFCAECVSVGRRCFSQFRLRCDGDPKST